MQDALNREQTLEQKLATMQRMIANSSEAAEGAFQVRSCNTIYDAS